MSNIKTLKQIPANISEYVCQFVGSEVFSAQIPSGEFIIARLSDLPLVMPEGLVIAAVLDRLPANAVLIFKKNNAYPSPLAQILDRKYTIYVKTPLEKAQMNTLLNEYPVEQEAISISQLNENQAILMYKNELDAIKEITDQEFHIMDVKVIEFVPTPAAGVLVSVCNSEDMGMRRYLASHHNKNIASLSNVERDFLKKTGMPQDQLAVHCEQDNKGVFHAYTAFVNQKDGNLVRLKYAQSTFAGMSEKLYEHFEKSKI